MRNRVQRQKCRAIIGLALLGIACSSAALSPRDIHASTATSVAALGIFDAGGERITERSATQVAPGRFVTVCDDIEASMTLRLRVGDAQSTALLGARDRERNLCELQAQQVLGQAATLQAALPQAGQRVFAVSNALGLGVGISEGVVAGVRQDAAGALIQFTAPSRPARRAVRCWTRTGGCSPCSTTGGATGRTSTSAPPSPGWPRWRHARRPPPRNWRGWMPAMRWGARHSGRPWPRMRRNGWRRSLTSPTHCASRPRPRVHGNCPRTS